VGVEHQASYPGHELSWHIQILVGADPPVGRIRHGIVGGGVANLIVAAATQFLVPVASVDCDCFLFSNYSETIVCEDKHIVIARFKIRSVEGE